MKPKKVTVEQGAEILKRFQQEHPGKFFRVEFQTREDPTKSREMLCIGKAPKLAKELSKGGKLPYNPLEKGLLSVCDMDRAREMKTQVPGKGAIKSPFRMVNLRGLKNFTVAGVYYEVIQE